MNRSILIVICDFLLVSLLVFSTVDINDVAEDGRTKEPSEQQMQAAVTNRATPGGDLANAMRTALNEEKQQREVMATELTRAREAAKSSEEARTGLQQQYAAAQTNVENLGRQLQANATISTERLSALEAELQRQRAAAERFQQQLQQSNQLVQAERDRLANQLQVAEAERRFASERVAAAQELVKAERAEKAQLAAGVQALATNSSKLAAEIREYRPMAANSVYSDFVSNRVQATFAATRPGVLSPILGGTSTKRRDAQTVLVTDGKNIYAISHIEDTPLDFWSPGTDWDEINGTLTRDGKEADIHSLSFHRDDPRVLYMPVTAAEAKRLGGRIYQSSSDPYKFQDAVLVGTRDDYYGECKFEIDSSTPGYVKLDRSVLRGLFGHFNPTKGDLVLSKQGELLGVMANSTYCLMLRGFEANSTIAFGDTRDKRTGMLLSSLHNTVLQLPGKLQ